MLEADVNVGVAKDMLARVKARALGADVLKSLTPGQQVIKIVHEELRATLGEVAPLMKPSAPPVSASVCPFMWIVRQGRPGW